MPPSDFTPRFPAVLDSTMLADFRTCPRLFYYHYIRRMRPGSGISIHLHAGGAYATGLERTRTHYLLHGDSEAAQAVGFRALMKAYGMVECPEQYPYKGPERLGEAFLKYFQRWPLESDSLKLLHINGTPGVEFSFAFPLPLKHPITGDPLLYGGRVDWFGEFNKSLFLVDEKTTSYFTKDWAAKWSLRAQFMAYCYAARLHGHPVLGALVRGVALKPAAGPEFCEAGPILFPAWKLDRWYNQALDDVQRMLWSWHGESWDWTYGESCNQFGGCVFQDLCRTKDDEPWITPTRYTEDTWSPIGDKS